jgi:Flp pilus assembly protein TadG
MDVKKQKGQALIEFIVFLPFMLMMYTVVISLGDAIYGSINQQKATRSYFYYRLSNNSQISRPQRQGTDLVNAQWSMFGHFFVGWADYLLNSQPVAPCYRLNLPFAPSGSDTCEASYTDTTTQFIRVATVYGVCGATMVREDAGNFTEMPAGTNDPAILDAVLQGSSCLIRE